MRNHEHRIHRHGLPIYNACDPRRALGIDKYVIHVKIVMPNHTSQNLLVPGHYMRKYFETVL